MLTRDLIHINEESPNTHKKHPKCKGSRDYWGEFDCDYGTILSCDECKYGVGRKDPEAKSNQI